MKTDNFLDFFKKKKEIFIYGFSEEETWDLYYYAAKWAYPRLKQFAKRNDGGPSNLTSYIWKRILNEMLFGLEYVLDKDEMEHEEKLKIEKRGMRGLAFISKYYFDLWY